MIKFVNFKQDKSILKNVKQLYISAFPKDERISFLYLKRKAKQKCEDIFAVFDDENFVGMTCLVYYENITFIFYLATDEKVRNQGYGTKILNEIKNLKPNGRIVLNIEAVDENSKDDEQKIRRQNFYKRNGFESNGYIFEEEGVLFESLSFGGIVSHEEYTKLLKNYMGKFMYAYYYKNNDNRFTKLK